MARWRAGRGSDQGDDAPVRRATPGPLLAVAGVAFVAWLSLGSFWRIAHARASDCARVVDVRPDRRRGRYECLSAHELARRRLPLDAGMSQDEAILFLAAPGLILLAVIVLAVVFLVLPSIGARRGLRIPDE